MKSNFEQLETGKIGLIRQEEDGRIIQIGVTENQSNLLQQFLGIISQESPLVEMGEDYELIHKKS